MLLRPERSALRGHVALQAQGGRLGHDSEEVDSHGRCPPAGLAAWRDLGRYAAAPLVITKVTVRAGVVEDAHLRAHGCDRERERQGAETGNESGRGRVDEH